MHVKHHCSWTQPSSHPQLSPDQGVVESDEQTSCLWDPPVDRVNQDGVVAKPSDRLYGESDGVGPEQAADGEFARLRPPLPLVPSR
jgi:hypothetical protein